MSRLPAIPAGGRGRRIALVVLCALGQAGAAGVAAFATRDLIGALGQDGGPLPLAPAAALGLSGFAAAAFRIGERVAAERVGQDYAAALRLRLFRHIGRMPAADVARRRSGGLSLRFVGDLASVRGWVSLGLARLLSAAVLLPVGLGTAALLDPALAVAAGLPVLPGLAAMWAGARGLEAPHRRLRQRRSSLAAGMSERVAHAPELRLAGRTGVEARHLRARSAALVAAALAVARRRSTLAALPDAISGAAAAAILLAAATRGLGVPETVGALTVLGFLLRPLRDLAGVADRHRAWRVARTRCEGLLASRTLPRARGGAGSRMPKGPLALSFEAVASGALDGVSAELGAGRKVALLGPNGAGKSTLLALAAGLERPRAGKVRVGGLDPARLDPGARRRGVFLASPGSPILSGSLRRAATLGIARRPKDRRLLAHLEAFGLGPLVARLGGLDGRVAESGRTLSTGERHRLILARAALSGAGLLLLDDLDAGLDEEGRTLCARFLAGWQGTALVATPDPRLAAHLDGAWTLGAGGLADCAPRTPDSRPLLQAVPGPA